jgi:hypothetical protein
VPHAQDPSCVKKVALRWGPGFGGPDPALPVEPQHRHSIDLAGYVDRRAALIEQLWHRSQGVEPRDIGGQPRPVPKPPVTCTGTKVISRSGPLLYSADPATEFLRPSIHPSGVRPALERRGGLNRKGGAELRDDPRRRLPLGLAQCVRRVRGYAPRVNKMSAEKSRWPSPRCLPSRAVPFSMPVSPISGIFPGDFARRPEWDLTC